MIWQYELCTFIIICWHAGIRTSKCRGHGLAPTQHCDFVLLGTRMHISVPYDELTYYYGTSSIIKMYIIIRVKETKAPPQ